MLWFTNQGKVYSDNVRVLYCVTIIAQSLPDTHGTVEHLLLE